MRYLYALSLAIILWLSSGNARSSEGFDDLAKSATLSANDDALVASISASSIAYDLSVSEICKLNDLHLSPRVIAAAVNHGRQKRGEAVQNSNAAPSPGFETLEKLVKAGTDEDVLIGFISSVPTPYDLTVDEILALNKAGAPVKAVECAVGVGKVVRSLGPATTKEAAQAIDKLNLRSLLKTEPRTQFVLKDKSGKEWTLNRWTQDEFTVFMLLNNKQPVKTIVSIASTLTIAEYKTEEVKTQVTPQRTVETNGSTETIPPVFETRMRQVCIVPEKVAYMLPNRTVLSHVIFYEYANGDKGAYKFKQGTMTIGKDEYEIVEMRNGSR